MPRVTQQPGDGSRELHAQGRAAGDPTLRCPAPRSSPARPRERLLQLPRWLLASARGRASESGLLRTACGARARQPQRSPPALRTDDEAAVSAAGAAAMGLASTGLPAARTARPRGKTLTPARPQPCESTGRGAPARAPARQNPEAAAPPALTCEPSLACEPSRRGAGPAALHPGSLPPLRHSGASEPAGPGPARRSARCAPGSAPPPPQPAPRVPLRRRPLRSRTRDAVLPRVQAARPAPRPQAAPGAWPQR